jgi:hypothetical protein
LEPIFLIAITLDSLIDFEFQFVKAVQLLEITVKILKVTIEEFVQRLKAVKLVLKLLVVLLIGSELVTIWSKFKFTFAIQLFERFINFKKSRPELVIIRSNFAFTFALLFFKHFINIKNQ